MWSIYVGFQAARPHCGQSASDLDAAIDAAIPVIERRLIEIGEISAEAAQEYRAAEASMWQKGAGFAEDQEAACQSANPTLWGLTPDQVGETAAAVLAASPEMLSDDCI
jgi:hypothetical protein